MAILRLLRLFALLITYAIIFSVLRIWLLLRVGQREAYRQQPFSVPLSAPRRRLLLVGDSLIVGIGVSDPKFSLAGRLSETYKDTRIDNLGACGAQVKHLMTTYSAINGNTYDVIVVQIGGNDVIHLKPIDQLRADLSAALKYYQRHSQHIILMSYGNVGQTGRFWWPLRRMYSVYSLAMRDTFAQVAIELKIEFIDFLAPTFDPTVQPRRYLSADGLHPNDEGYKRYFEALRSRLFALHCRS